MGIDGECPSPLAWFHHGPKPWALGWTPGLFWLQGHRAAPGRVEHPCLSYRIISSVKQHLAQELVLLFIHVHVFTP